MNEAIKLAIEGGLKEGEKWKFITANNYWVQWLDGNGTPTNISTDRYILDPLFWQALGKALKWIDDEDLNPTWLIYALDFLEDMLLGHDINDLFKKIINEEHV